MVDEYEVWDPGGRSRRPVSKPRFSERERERERTRRSLLRLTLAQGNRLCSTPQVARRDVALVQDLKRSELLRWRRLSCLNFKFKCKFIHSFFSFSLSARGRGSRRPSGGTRPSRAAGTACERGSGCASFPDFCLSYSRSLENTPQTAFDKNETPFGLCETWRCRSRARRSAWSRGGAPSLARRSRRTIASWTRGLFGKRSSRSLREESPTTCALGSSQRPFPVSNFVTIDQCSGRATLTRAPKFSSSRSYTRASRLVSTTQCVQKTNASSPTRVVGRDNVGRVWRVAGRARLPPIRPATRGPLRPTPKATVHRLAFLSFSDTLLTLEYLCLVFPESPILGKRSRDCCCGKEPSQRPRARAFESREIVLHTRRARSL